MEAFTIFLKLLPLIGLIGIILWGLNWLIKKSGVSGKGIGGVFGFFWRGIKGGFKILLWIIFGLTLIILALSATHWFSQNPRVVQAPDPTVYRWQMVWQDTNLARKGSDDYVRVMERSVTTLQFVFTTDIHSPTVVKGKILPIGRYYMVFTQKIGDPYGEVVLQSLETMDKTPYGICRVTNYEANTKQPLTVQFWKENPHLMSETLTIFYTDEKLSAPEMLRFGK